MGLFDFAEKAAKFIFTESEEEKDERLQEKQESDRQKRLDSLRNPMRTYMKKGDIGDKELNFLKSVAAKLGMDAHEFEMRFDLVRSAREEYNAKSKKKSIFSSESPDLFFYSEDEIEDFFEGKMGVFNMSEMAEMKMEQKIENEMLRPHFDTAFDEAFSSVSLTQESPELQQTQQSQTTPPPLPPQVQYTLNINGQNQGPYDMQQLQQMVLNGQLTRQTYVWKQGMANWDFAGNVQELSMLFGSMPPPPPTMPPSN